MNNWFKFILILAALGLTFLGYRELKSSYWPSIVKVDIVNRVQDCDVDGAFFVILKVYDDHHKDLTNKIVLPQLSYPNDSRKDYDSLYINDSTHEFIFTVLCKYSIFENSDISYGCTGAHKIKIIKIENVKKVAKTAAR
jgi:hypothetical protein